MIVNASEVLNWSLNSDSWQTLAQHGSSGRYLYQMQGALHVWLQGTSLISQGSATPGTTHQQSPPRLVVLVVNCVPIAARGKKHCGGCAWMAESLTGRTMRAFDSFSSLPSLRTLLHSIPCSVIQALLSVVSLTLCG